MKLYTILILIFCYYSTAFSQNISISGKIETANQQAICDASVQLFDDNGTLISSVNTDQTGTFSHDNIPSDQTYILLVEKDGNILNGLSTFDLVLMEKHLMGETLIEDAFALYATDVDDSNSLSIFDMIAVRKYILTIDESRPLRNWYFFNSDANVQDALNPWATNDLLIRRFENLSTSITNADFVGYKTADINSSAISCEN